MQLTQNRIEKLLCPTGRKDMLVFDDEQQGLGVRVTANGGKTYIVQYRGPGGLKRRMPIGSFSAISLGAAREAARAIMGDAAKGLDPFADRKQKVIEARAQVEREALTLDALIGQWAERRLSSRRQSYSIEAPRALRVAFAAQLEAPAAALDAKTVRKVVDRIAEAGKATSARLAAAGSAAYNWAMSRGLVACNPFDTVQIERTPARDRVLANDELRAVWRVSFCMGAYGAIVRMLILTGQRRDEVAGMTWDEISDDCATWTIPSGRAKNGVVHIVPLSDETRELLQTTPRCQASSSRRAAASSQAGVVPRRSSTKRAASQAGACTTFAGR